MILLEGGNVFDNTEPVAKEDVPTVVDIVHRELPPDLSKQLIGDIGSAGYKVESGDIDLFLDSAATIKHYGATDEKGAKISLAQYYKAKNPAPDPKYDPKIKGRNVHLDIPYIAKRDGKQRFAQVDIMVIADAKRVADWHQHGPRGSYDDPNFKADHLFILLNSIGKFLGLKTDGFGGVVMRRDNNEVVADNRNDSAKILLNPGAKASDLNSVSSVMKALEGDPDREGKLAQARQDQQKGLLTLPEAVTPGTAAWFRKLGYNL